MFFSLPLNNPPCGPYLARPLLSVISTSLCIQQDKVKPGANGVLGTEAGSQRAQEQVHLKSTELPLSRSTTSQCHLNVALHLSAFFAPI
jgi:hypothetical protein